ncbi:AAA family ATPase [Pseudoalteromonas sp. NEC-BIFX-2020_015]|uniref:AAA family ATPase n=1 Tax=Pseudoalteromonas sp. NEC-BIFX-2020_015 TaxID=2729544 RepID=UPI00146157DB|nr:AAA family ATPase [Pseudoalteromonas sp. NEC-BIFX-2020_015]NMR25064.1 AAA family ATPase [Pseudoalteromonas sp. NEC-BIFX-2020_015]
MKKLAAWLDSLALSHSPNFAECVGYLGEVFPLLHQFAETEQDSIWHAEGNVAIHTEMVLSQLYEILANDAAYIKGVKRQVLILSALLHDIAKPITTKRKQIAGVERVVAPKHEEIGASYLASKLLELPLEYEAIRAIMGLVGFHQMPKRLVIKNQSYSDYLHLALNANLELLYWLELADMKGRKCEDLDLQIDLLEQFRMFSEDYELWFAGDLARSILKNIQVKSSYDEQAYLDGYAVRQLATGQISMPEEAVAKNYQGAQQYSHLFVMCGISGSGKSTWIAKNLKGFTVISLDEIRKELNGKRSCQKYRGQVLQLAKSRLKTALANKQNVVWDATNIRKDFRQIICELGLNYGALITIVALQIKEGTARSNNKSRQHIVGDDIITNQLNKFEWPSITEGHRMLIIGEKGSELLRQGTFE